MTRKKNLSVLVALLLVPGWVLAQIIPAPPAEGARMVNTYAVETLTKKVATDESPLYTISATAEGVATALNIHFSPSEDFLAEADATVDQEMIAGAEIRIALHGMQFGQMLTANDLPAISMSLRSGGMEGDTVAVFTTMARYPRRHQFRLGYQFIQDPARRRRGGGRHHIRLA